MLVYLRDGSAETIVLAATLTEKLRVRLAMSTSHNTELTVSGNNDPAESGVYLLVGWLLNVPATG